MHRDLRTLRTYIRLLAEAAISISQAEISGLALLVFRGSTDIDMILYDPVVMKNHIVNSSTQKSENVASEAVVGFICYANPHTPGKTWRAKVVGGSAAKKGYGPLMYDLAMDDAGALTSDRGSVSADAERVWDKYQERDDVEKLKFDDVYNPKTPPVEDDAKLHPKNRDSLNYAYKLKGDGPNGDQLIKNHEKLVSEITSEFPSLSKNDINTKIRVLGVDFFGMKYDETYG